MKLIYQKLASNKLFLQTLKDPFSENSESNNTNEGSKPWVLLGCYVVGVILFALTISICIVRLLVQNGEWSEAITGRSQPAQVMSCYYNTPDENNESEHQLLPSQIDPHLCTHINIAFARVVHKEIFLEPSQWETLKEVVKLKQANPQLKVLLSVGGAGENNGFSEMVIDHASRKVFIKSIKSVLRNYSLDGVDLDWEFPALHLKNGNLAERERQHFSQLLYEIRTEYIREKRDYLLTVAIAAPETVADVAYDVDQINLYVDFANVMTYDYHYYSKYTPFTGLNSPLFARDGEELFLATLNINYTVRMYATRGLDASKIAVGIPTYGHTFSLVNPDNPAVGSPAAGVGALGARGFVDYPGVCAFRRAHNVSARFEPRARVPWLHRAREWVSYESPRSVAAKARFVRAAGLRGAMLYSLNADDHRAACGGAAFPLARAARRALVPRLARP